MMSSRQFIAAAAVAGSGIALGAYALKAQNARTQYQRHVEQTWRHGGGETVQGRELLLELVRYATLALSSADLNLLEAAGTGPGVSVLLLTDRQVMENVLDFVIQGNTAQIRDPAFVRELKDWVEAGRAFERFALQATALGVRTAHLNQPVEVPSLRPAFAGLVGAAGARPDLVIRFGRGPEMPRSVRRPLEAVLL
ncbi:hypothetical protein [Thioalkalivibrio sulfidiphilus]|uniref:hypothetical protein n=1 Tax=Thioalkalivibrio sulfidiphilus TaxID=1033854 RepID=UPI0003686B5C|nr:hypothetical protein [Thioalkalivibrio sulfidiphilus]